MAQGGPAGATGKKMSNTPFADFVSRLPKWMESFKSSSTNSASFKAAADGSNHGEQFNLVACFLKQDSMWASTVKMAGQDPNGKSDIQAVAARNQGNLLFAEKRWQKALEEYNKSLCYAPASAVSNDSSQQHGKASLSLALGYGNRSAVYFNQGRHLECVLDVQLAVKHGYPQDKVEKLILRMAKSYMAMQHYAEAVDCLQKTAGMVEADELLLLGKNRLKKQQVSGRKAPEVQFHRPNGPMYMGKAAAFFLSGGQHPDFPSASALVGTAQTLTWGKHFVATTDIAAGDVLLKEHSFVNAPLERNSRSNCMACSVWTDNPTPCKACPHVVFCSVECASGAKAELHAKECPQLWTFGAGNQELDSGAIALQGLLTCVYRIFLMKSLGEWSIIAEKLSSEPDEEESIKSLSALLPEGYDQVYSLAETKPTCIDEQILCGFGAWFVVTVLQTSTQGYKGMDAKMRKFFGGLALRHLRAFSWHMTWTSDSVVNVPGMPTATSVTSGFALHPTISFFPNSCASNVCVALMGDFLILRAIRPIKKNEMLTVRKHKSMSFSKFPKKERRLNSTLSMLAGGPSHPCQCIACRNDWPTEDKMDRNAPWKAVCQRCSTLCEVTGDDFVKCGRCGFGAVLCLSKLYQFVKFLKVEKRHFSTGEELNYFLQLSREASNLVQPHPLLSRIYDMVAYAWGCEGNKRVVLDY